MIDIAKTGSTCPPMLIAPTMDGAQLTNELGHVTAGVKIVDPRCVHPITGIPVIQFQSRDLCFPFQITFGKDCGSLYEVDFDDFLSFFGGDVLCEGSADGKPELSSFQVVSPQDLSSGWKTTGKGGTSSNYFCISCMCHKEEKQRFTTDEDDALTASV